MDANNDYKALQLRLEHINIAKEMLSQRRNVCNHQTHSTKNNHLRDIIMSLHDHLKKYVIPEQCDKDDTSNNDADDKERERTCSPANTLFLIDILFSPTNFTSSILCCQKKYMTYEHEISRLEERRK